MNVSSSFLVNYSESEIPFIPSDLIPRVLSHLPPASLLKCKLVNKEWNQKVDCAFQEKMEIFGKDAWNSLCGYCIEDEDPPVPARMNLILRKFLYKFQEWEEGPACSLILMPRGLSLNQAIAAFGKGSSSRMSHFDSHAWDQVIAKYGNRKVKQSYWLLVSHTIAPNTWGKSMEEQKEQILTLDANFRIPRLLEIVASTALNHLKSGNFYYGPDPLRETRTISKINGIPITIGGYKNYNRYKHYVTCFYNYPGRTGAAVCRRLRCLEKACE